jgi:hypothetical protein
VEETPKARAERQEITTEEIKEFLRDKRLTLDCGHKYCVHNLSNTLILNACGYACCHNCY